MHKNVRKAYRLSATGSDIEANRYPINCVECGLLNTIDDKWIIQYTVY